MDKQIDKQTELKALLCDKFLLIESLQAKANQTTSEIQQLKQAIAKEITQEIAKEPSKPEPEVKKSK